MLDTTHPYSEENFGQARIVCIADEDVEVRLRRFMRLALGEPQWTGTGTIVPTVAAYYIQKSQPFNEALLSALSSGAAPYLNSIIVDPTLKSWSGLKRLTSFVKNEQRWLMPSILMGTNARDFERKVSHMLKVLGVDCESRLLQQLSAEHESVLLEDWKQQFARAGFGAYPSKIIACMRMISFAELSRRLRFADLPRGGRYCVLGSVGSDRILLRLWDGEYGGQLHCGSLRDTVQNASRGDTVLLFVDAIQSGAQIVSALHMVRQYWLQKALKLIIRPAYATRFGIRKILKEFPPDIVNVELDTETALLVENIDPQDSERKVSELQIRLDEFEVEPDFRNAIISFCRRVGSELKAIEDQSDVPDFLLGLGGYGLGLTTLLAGRPSKGVLPVLRLGGMIPLPESESKMHWVPLIRHKNTSGTG